MTTTIMYMTISTKTTSIIVRDVFKLSPETM